MKKYAKIIDEKTKEVQVGVGCSDSYYEEIGMTLMDVEYGWDGNYYVEGYVPEQPIPPTPTDEEQKENRASAYREEVDPITSHIQRLRDQDPVPEGEIAELIAERDAKVEEIKARYPYADEQ